MKPEELIHNLQVTIDEAINKKSLMMVGRFVVEMIRQRTRRGYGVEKIGARLNRLKKLDKKYVEYRKTQKLHKETSPGKSNLTFTGVLLDSLTVKETQKTKDEGSFVIGANNRARKGGITNDDLAKFVQEQGRPFMGLAKSELDKIDRYINTNISSVIKRHL